MTKTPRPPAPTFLRQTALAALLLAAAPAAGEAIRLSDRVELGAASGATAAVRDECGIQTSLPQAVSDAARDVELVSGAAKGRRTLELAIVEVHAPGGGPFSGPKWLTVTAELREGGGLVASARAKRVTSGAFGGGTCAQLQKVVRAVAVDIAAWLANPTRGAELGDAR
jgi:hypothetical protein